mmetsp:Transcript_34725/g.58466  ORF Transcript_34725/g.58466 Transcript_34725/m.58466 type:complete len:82 (+) Transcript_34725:62-307(+)
MVSNSIDSDTRHGGFGKSAKSETAIENAGAKKINGRMSEWDIIRGNRRKGGGEFSLQREREREVTQWWPPRGVERITPRAF